MHTDMSREASKRKLAQPPAHRILTADELGLLKGDHAWACAGMHASSAIVFAMFATRNTAIVAAAMSPSGTVCRAALHVSLLWVLPPPLLVANAVLEVPAGEHWAGTSVVQRW